MSFLLLGHCLLVAEISFLPLNVVSWLKSISRHELLSFRGHDEFHMMFVGDIEHAYYFFIRHVLIGMQGDLHRRIGCLDTTQVTLQVLRVNSNRFLLA